MSTIEYCRHSNWHEFYKHSHIDVSKVEWKNWSSRTSFLMCKDVNVLQFLIIVSVWKFSYTFNPSDRCISSWSFIAFIYSRDVVKKYQWKGFRDRCTRHQTLWHCSTSWQRGNFFVHSVIFKNYLFLLNFKILQYVKYFVIFIFAMLFFKLFSVMCIYVCVCVCVCVCIKFSRKYKNII